MTDLIWSPIKIRLGQIIPWSENPRMSTKAQAQRLIKSERELGQIQTLAVSPFDDGKVYLYDGHQRCAAWMTVKDPSYEVTALQSNRMLTEDERKKVSVLLHTATGSWSWEALSSWSAADLREWGMDAETLKGWNTDANNLKELLNAETSEPVDAEPQIDRAAELQVKWQTATGQLWKLGEHRLLIGDCTVRENVERLMGGERADLLFTSPPYGNQRDYTEEATESLKDWDALMINTFSNPILNENAQIIVNLGLIHKENEWMPYYDNWIEWMRSQGWRRFGLYVWDSGFGLMGNWNGRLAPSFEFVFHFNKTSKQPNKIIEKKKESVQIKKGDGLRKKDGSIGKLSNPQASLQTHKIPDSVIRIFRSTETIRQFHPAVFSLEFAEFNINTWTIEGNLTYEPFGGSGTTIIAAHNLNRRCYACEISPNYGGVILERFYTATGITPELVE